MLAEKFLGICCLDRIDTEWSKDGWKWRSERPVAWTKPMGWRYLETDSGRQGDLDAQEQEQYAALAAAIR